MLLLSSGDVLLSDYSARLSGYEPDGPCGGIDGLLSQVFALLPRGRAWQTNETGPRPGTTLYGYWRAFSEVVSFLNGRLCDLRREFFCATMTETEPEWLAEYGLPDACDPYPILCEKVRAVGEPYCETYVRVAEAAGWDIDCIGTSQCAAPAGCAAAGHGVTGGPGLPATLAIRVYLGSSPAYSGYVTVGPIAGCMAAGIPLVCPPDLSSLDCLLSRLVHAHVRIDYETRTYRLG